jgi:hypothetical protein
MQINDKTHSTILTLRDESNEPNYVMIRQCGATVSNDGLIRLKGFVSQFPVHLCNYFYK